MKTYTFNDVLIQPQYSEVRSRKDVKLDVSIGDIDLSIPVISANMKTITGPRMAAELYNRGSLGVLHRFNSIEGAILDFEETKDDIDVVPYSSSTTVEQVRKNCTMVSIGTSGDMKERFQELYNAGARYFCVDIAHGHCLTMRETLEYIKSEKSDIHVMAGNVATIDGAQALAAWGADAIKVGIGPGSMCQTRTNTGVGVPQLWALEEIQSIRHTLGQAKIIADGGIKIVGDIAKALKFADAVMLGRFLAGSMETPGDVFKRKDGSRYKIYGGSAAASNKSVNGQRPEFVEGVTEEVPLGDHVKFLLKEIREGLQSACSYVGANNLQEYKKLCKFVHIGSGGKAESKI